MEVRVRVPFPLQKNNGPLAQLARALDLHSRGRGFKPHTVHKLWRNLNNWLVDHPLKVVVRVRVSFPLQKNNGGVAETV